MDQRGFGYSDGKRAVVENKEDVYNDQWLFIFEAIKQYKIDQQKTPMFLFGRSFGGLLVTNMSAQPLASSMFSGVVSYVPFFRCWTEKLYRYEPIFKVMDVLHPYWEKPEEKQKRDKEYLEKWGELAEDPMIVRKFTARMAKLWIDEQKKAEQSVSDTDIPILFIEAEKDDVVNNAATRELFEKSKKKGK